jgi:hypothetical protein
MLIALNILQRHMYTAGQGNAAHLRQYGFATLQKLFNS